MIRSNYNQCLVRMLKVELIRLLYCLFKANHVLNDCHRTICVSSPVDHAAFAHEEERFVISYEFHSSLKHFFKTDFHLFIVYRIGLCIFIKAAFLAENSL